jgi:hypothetical protein
MQQSCRWPAGRGRKRYKVGAGVVGEHKLKGRGQCVLQPSHLRSGDGRCVSYGQAASRTGECVRLRERGGVTVGGEEGAIASSSSCRAAGNNSTHVKWRNFSLKWPEMGQQGGCTAPARRQPNTPNAFASADAPEAGMPFSRRRDSACCGENKGGRGNTASRKEHGKLQQPAAAAAAAAATAAHPNPQRTRTGAAGRKQQARRSDREHEEGGTHVFLHAITVGIHGIRGRGVALGPDARGPTSYFWGLCLRDFTCWCCIIVCCIFYTIRLSPSHLPCDGPVTRPDGGTGSYRRT